MSQSPAAFDERLKINAREIEALLEALLAKPVLADEIARPESLRSAMHYAVLNGGKRLRPFLVVESALLLGGDRQAALRVGAALECVHCYSLVHDDLPAMDDDDLRRGKPTVHIAFDEATAILAGDSLLTYAFDIIAALETALPDARKTALILALARSAGLGGMAGAVRLWMTDDQIAQLSPAPTDVQDCWERLTSLTEEVMLRNGPAYFGIEECQRIVTWTAQRISSARASSSGRPVRAISLRARASSASATRVWPER